MDKTKRLKAYWANLTTRQQYHVYFFAQHPKVGQNQGYMIGYLSALADNGLIEDKDHSYWLAFFGTPDSELLAEVIKLFKGE